MVVDEKWVTDASLLVSPCERCGDRFAIVTREPLWYRYGEFRRVVLVSGHVTDTPDRSSPRFPEAAVEDVRRRLAEELDRIGIGPSDLLICGGARGTDLLAAEEALRRCSTVWVLLALPPEEFVRSSVATEGTDWASKFWLLLQRAPAWHLGEELENLPQGDEVFVRANDWMLKVAKAQALAEDFHVIVVWDGEGAAGPGGTGEMVELARMAGADFTVLPPMRA